jgi:hypothetical protein
MTPDALIALGAKLTFYVTLSLFALFVLGWLLLRRK